MNDVTMQDMQSPPAILRIKRKRTDEPLDALVIEAKSRRKKSRGASGFFQFAETVAEEAFWQDPSLTKDLRDRIATLASGDSLAEKAERGEKPSPGTPSGRRYTIVKKEPDTRSSVPPRAGQPSVNGNGDSNMFDAVPEADTSAVRSVETRGPEIDKFLPMLEEYLRLNNISSDIAASSTDNGDEYVWDVFYHRPVIADWAAAANIATVSGLPSLGQYDSDSASDSAGDPDDEDSNSKSEDFYRNDYPEEDPDEDSDNNFDSEEEYPDVSDDEDREDERELTEFLSWHRRR